MNIGILSLGLIGGSLLKVLSKKGLKITAVTRSPETAKKAEEFSQKSSTDLNDLKECDVVFVCSPMNKTPEILNKLESILKPETIVTDACSLKQFVTEKQRPYKFIGSHPMAGTENSGFDASFEELFEDAKWVITPNEKTSEKDIKTLENIIKLTGATTLKMDAKEHDKAVALISHMPMLVAQALMKTALKDKNALKLAASGFKDMTRLACSNTEMANDMVKMNSENITEAAISLMESIKSMLDDNYLDQIETLKNFRKGMYSKDGKNILS